MSVDDHAYPAHAVRPMLSSEDEAPIVVHTFPASDKEFADVAGASLVDARAAETPVADGDALRELVESRLRTSYRNARIVVQDQLADLGGRETVWYAYRDGRIREPNAQREHLYAVMAVARRTVRESRIALDKARTVSHGAGFEDDDPERSETPRS